MGLEGMGLHHISPMVGRPMVTNPNVMGQPLSTHPAYGSPSSQYPTNPGIPSQFVNPPTPPTPPPDDDMTPDDLPPGQMRAVFETTSGPRTVTAHLVWLVTFDPENLTDPLNEGCLSREWTQDDDPVDALALMQSMVRRHTLIGQRTRTATPTPTMTTAPSASDYFRNDTPGSGLDT